MTIAVLIAIELVAGTGLLASVIILKEGHRVEDVRDACLLLVPSILLLMLGLAIAEAVR